MFWRQHYDIALGIERLGTIIFAETLKRIENRQVEFVGIELCRKGTPMRYIRSTFAPADGRCMCLFEAANAEDVKRLNEEAKLPYSRIVEALDLTP